MENPKIPAVSNTQEYDMEICDTDMHTLSTSMLCIEQIGTSLAKTSVPVTP